MEQARPEPALWLFSEFHHLQREVEMLARQRDELAAQLRSERQERATLSATLSSARAALKLLLSENNLLTRELAEFDVMCCYDEPVAMEQPIKQYPDTQTFRCLDVAFRPGVIMLAGDRVEFRPVLPREDLHRKVFPFASIAQVKLGRLPKGLETVTALRPLEIRTTSGHCERLLGLPNPSDVCTLVNHYRRVAASQDAALQGAPAASPSASIADMRLVPVATLANPAATTAADVAAAAALGAHWPRSNSALRAGANIVWGAASSVGSAVTSLVRRRSASHPGPAQAAAAAAAAAAAGGAGRGTDGGRDACDVAVASALEHEAAAAAQEGQTPIYTADGEDDLESFITAADDDAAVAM